MTPLILVSNDDGIDAPGIRSLAGAMRSIGDVVVVAPDAQQSAVGHALTVSLPLRATRVDREPGMTEWAVSGTPADCVKLGVKRLLERTPDLIVSGINHGRNTAVSLIYSGTVSAATEGTVMGIPSVAFSLDSFASNVDFMNASHVAVWLARKVLQQGLPRGVLLNVNVPNVTADRVRGVRIAPQGDSYWDDIYEERTDPMGRPYYWLSGHNVLVGPPGSDDELLTEGFVTITPVHYRLTDDPMMATLREWDLETDSPLMPEGLVRRTERIR